MKKAKWFLLTGAVALCAAGVAVYLYKKHRQEEEEVQTVYDNLSENGKTEEKEEEDIYVDFEGDNGEVQA